MIKCKDPVGNVLNHTLRVPDSNAIVFEPDDKYASYMREKAMTEKIAKMESQLNELLSLMSKTIK